MSERAGNARARSERWIELIAEIASGSQDAMARFYEQSSAIAFGLAMRILGDRSEAEEVTVDVYMQVWRRAGDYDAGRGTPLAWLCTLARSRAIDRLRSAGRDQARSAELTREPGSTAPDPEASVMTLERRARVREAMAELSPEQREAIEIAYFRGLTHTEIARLLGQPLGTVKTRIRCGMMRLRDILHPESEAL